MKTIIPVLLLLTMFYDATAIRIESGKDVVISKPVFENLYIAGGTVTVNAPVHGDLIIAGGNITINDTITGDVLLGGGTVTLNGYAGDDVRVVGGQLYIRNGIAGELVVSGGKIETGRDALVNKGVLMAGGDIVLNGRIKGNTTAYGGNITINGIAENTVELHAGELAVNGTIMGKSILAARQIVIGQNAYFNNEVRYWNRGGTLDFKQTLKNGSAIYDPALRVNTGEWYFLGFATVIALLWYVGMALLMIALIQYLFSRTMQRAGETVYTDSARSLGYGLLYLIAVPISVVVLMMTVIGIPVAFMLLFAYITIILLATTITSVVASNWINKRYSYHWNHWHLVLTAFGMFILLKLVASTPFFGSLVMLVLTCTAFGAILLNINWKRQTRKSPLEQDQLEKVLQ